MSNIVELYILKLFKYAYELKIIITSYTIQVYEVSLHCPIHHKNVKS